MSALLITNICIFSITDFFFPCFTSSLEGPQYSHKEAGIVHDLEEIEIDSVNSGGYVQLESIISASHGLGAIDSGQKPELVTTM